MRTGWEVGKKGHVKLTLSDFEIKNAGMVKSLGCSEVNVVHAAIVSIRYQLWSTGSLVGRHLSQGIRRLTELAEETVQLELAGATFSPSPRNCAAAVAAISSIILQPGSCPTAPV